MTGRVAAARLGPGSFGFHTGAGSGFGGGAGGGGWIDAVAIALSTSVTDRTGLVTLDATGSAGKAAASGAFVFFLVRERLQERWRLRSRRIRSGDGQARLGRLRGWVVPQRDALRILSGPQHGVGRERRFLHVLHRTRQIAGQGGLGRGERMRHGAGSGTNCIQGARRVAGEKPGIDCRRDDAGGGER